MKISQGSPSRPTEFQCMQCGFKKLVSSSPGGQDLEKFKLAPKEEEKTQFVETTPPPEPTPTPAVRKKTSTVARKKGQDQAKRLTELRQVSKELISRIADLQIQFERRIEELQKSAVELQKVVESFHENS